MGDGGFLAVVNRCCPFSGGEIYEMVVVTGFHSISATLRTPSPQSSTLKSVNATVIGSFSSIEIMWFLYSMRNEIFNNTESSLTSINAIFSSRYEYSLFRKLYVTRCRLRTSFVPRNPAIGPP